MKKLITFTLLQVALGANANLFYLTEVSNTKAVPTIAQLKKEVARARQLQDELCRINESSEVDFCIKVSRSNVQCHPTRRLAEKRLAQLIDNNTCS